MDLLIPPKIKKGDTIGVCTPSTPAYKINEEIFSLGLSNLKKHGLKIKLGNLTSRRASQGYRSGTPQERAKELMELFCDSNISGIITTIGGMNSNSLIPYLNYAEIRNNPKVFCGYSDITSLHLALMKFSNLATYYGPGLMPHWSDFPSGITSSISSFFEAVSDKKRVITPFSQWSNHIRDWKTNDWKYKPREWKKNQGWKVLNCGYAKAPIIVCNLNTLSAACGTEFFPNFDGKILLLEEMEAPLSKEERSLRQLELIGVFDKISALLVGKPENLQIEGAPFGLDDLILEVLGKRDYPIVTEFDCSHTIPMHTIRQGSIVEIDAKDKSLTSLSLS